MLEKRIRCQVPIDNMQFSLNSCLESEPLMQFSFIMRQVQEKHQAKKKKLYYAFVDLEKAFDRVPKRGGEIIRSGRLRWYGHVMRTG